MAECVEGRWKITKWRPDKLLSNEMLIWLLKQTAASSNNFSGYRSIKKWQNINWALVIGIVLPRLTATDLSVFRVGSESSLILLRKKASHSWKDNHHHDHHAPLILHNSITVLWSPLSLPLLFPVSEVLCPNNWQKLGFLVLFFFFRARTSLQLFFPFLRLPWALSIFFRSWVLIQLKCKCILSIFFLKGIWFRQISQFYICLKYLL